MTQFSGQNDTSLATAVAAGPTSSVVVDKQQGMYYMAGKVGSICNVSKEQFPHSHRILVEKQWRG
jgi:hypothetical protein